VVLILGVLLSAVGGNGPSGFGTPGAGALVLAGAYIVGMLALTAVGRWVAARDLGLTAAGPRELMVGPVFARAYARE